MKKRLFSADSKIIKKLKILRQQYPEDILVTLLIKKNKANKICYRLGHVFLRDSEFDDDDLDEAIKLPKSLRQQFPKQPEYIR